MANKKIRLHPYVNGQPDGSTNLYPETNVESVQGLQEALNSKQDTIDENNPLPAAYVSGLEEELDGFVKKTTKVAGKTLEEDTETLEDYIYEKKVETNISLLDVPNWEEFSEISADTWLTIYEDLSGKIIQVGNYDSSYMVEIINTTNGSGYIITNTTNETFTADTWYEFEGYESEPVQTTTPDIKLNAENIIEGYENLFNAITSSETITITKTLKQKLDTPIKEATYDYTEKLALLDIPNWENIIEAMSSGSSGTIYYYEGADRAIQIGCGKYDDSSSDYDYRYDISITDYDMSTSTERRYHIQNVTTPWSRKDIWYETVFDGTYNTDIPITTPDIPLDAQYAEGTTYGALFDSIAGNKQINTTLQDKLEEPLKDKTYGKIEVVKEVLNDFVDENEYEYYDNMNFSSNDYELLSSLSDGMLIYEDEVGGTANYLITVSINKGTTALEVYDAFRDITYIYTIYALESFVNEWDNGTIPADLTVYTNCIKKSEVLKRMLNVGTHTEIEYKNQTLEEKNADIKNWKYEDGLKDIPDWSKFTDVLSFETFYNDSDKIVITASYDNRNYCYSININDVVNIKQYIIYSESVSFSEVSFEKNKWYEGILYDRETIPTQCDTPKIDLSKQYVIIDAQYQDLYNNLFDAIYQSITVDDKFNSMDGLLKDKIYDTIAEELVDGQSYGLTDNYDEFFEKYGNGQNTLIYGASINSSSSGGEQIASNSKAGEETIIRIELETDSTPIIRSEKKSETKAGDGAIPAPFGASLISILTNNYDSLYFAVNSNSWIYYNQWEQEWQNVSLEYMPKLTLDSSLIQNEDMLKDFLQLGYKEQTLGEKIEGFKDWLYETGEIKANVVYTLPSSYDYTNINEGRIYQAGITPGPTPIDPGGIMIAGGKSSINATNENTNEEQSINTRKSGAKAGGEIIPEYPNVIDVFSISVTKYSDYSYIQVSGTIDGDSYTFNQWSDEDGWYSDGNVYEHISIRLENTNYIYDEQSLKEILALKPLTLEEKINSMSSSSDEPLENKIYTHLDQVCELLSVPNWEGMGDSLTGWTNIYSYEHSDSGFSDTIYIGDLYDDNHYGVLMNIVSGEYENRYEIYNEDWSDTEYASGFEVKKNTWYKTVWDYESSPTTKSYTEEIPELEVQDSAVKNIDLFKCIYKYSPDTNQTLKEKFDSYKDWTYDKKDATYKLLTPNWDEIDTSSLGTMYDSDGDEELNYCKYSYSDEAYDLKNYDTNAAYVIFIDKIIGFEQDEYAITETYCNFSRNGEVENTDQPITKGVWYKADYSGQYPIFEEVDNAEMLFNEDYIVEEYKELFESLIQYIPEEITTLDEKLKYLITDYTEDNGALTSITVKDKETGEPTVLTVGGSSQEVIHNIKLRSSYGTRTIDLFFRIESSVYKTAMSFSDLENYLTSQGYEANGEQYAKLLPVSGRYCNNATTVSYGYVMGIYRDINTITASIRIAFVEINNNVGNIAYYGVTSAYTTITDDVKPK